MVVLILGIFVVLIGATVVVVVTTGAGLKVKLISKVLSVFSNLPKKIATFLMISALASKKS